LKKKEEEKKKNDGDLFPLLSFCSLFLFFSPRAFPAFSFFLSFFRLLLFFL